MALENDVQNLVKEVTRLNAFLKNRAPSKPTKAPFLVVTAEISATLAAAGATNTTAILTAEVPEGPDYQIVAITGFAATGTIPGTLTINNDWKASIIDSYRQIEWFKIAPSVTTGASGRLWARNIFPTVSGIYILPSPYQVPGKTIITVTVENWSTVVGGLTALQIAFHGYRVA